MSAIVVAPGLRYRHLTVAEVCLRQRDRHERERQAHNAGVCASPEPRPPTRAQVLGEFDPLTQRLAR